jgi:RNA polymerase sigma-70 factor (ECF subfamily)
MPRDIPPEHIDRFRDAVSAPAGAGPPGPADLAERERQLRESLKENRVAPCAVVAPQTDETLVLALQQELFVREAFDELYRRFEPTIRSWLMRRGVEYHQAHDLAQTLLLRCFKKRLHSYNPQRGPLSAFLYRATYNLWVEKVIRPRAERRIPLAEDLIAREAAAAEEAARRELAERLVTATAKLPSELRAVLELSVQEDLSHAQIAEQLRITVKASQQRLFKARRALEELLGLSLPPTNCGRPRKDSPAAEA